MIFFLRLYCNRFSRIVYRFSKKSKKENHSEYFIILHIKADKTRNVFKENLLATLYIFIYIFLLQNYRYPVETYQSY